MRRLTILAASVPAGLRATLCYAFAIVWAKGLAMLTVPLLTRMLPPAEFGRLELLSSAAEIGGLIAGAGLVDTLFRFASQPGKDSQLAAARIVGLSLVIALIGVITVTLFAPALAGAMPLPTPAGDIVLLGIAVAVEAAIGVPLGWLRLRRRAGAFATMSVLRATLQVGLVVALVTTGYGVEGVLWAGCVTCLIVASLLTVRQVRETGIAIAPQASLRMLAYGLPLIGSGIASFVLGTADRWLLAGSVTPAALAQYALAAKLASIVALLAQPFELWWYPQRLGLIDTQAGLDRSSRVVSAGAAGLLCAAAAIALVGPELVAIMAPASYAPAGAMMPFLIAGLVMQLLSSMANAGCYARRTSNVTMGVTSVAAAITLGLYLPLIPSFGVSGAIAATLVGQAVRLIVFAVISQRSVPLTWPLRRLTLIALAAAATSAAPMLGVTGLGCVGLVVTIVLALPVIAGRPHLSGLGLDLFRILRHRDIAALRRLFVNG